MEANLGYTAANLGHLAGHLAGLLPALLLLSAFWAPYAWFVCLGRLWGIHIQ